MTALPENSGTALLDKIALANLAAISSRVFSYYGRINQLKNAVAPAQTAIDLRLHESHPGEPPLAQWEFRYFSRGLKAQLLDTISAAIIVLVHSFFDDAISELLATCIIRDESRWRDRIIGEWKKQYSLGEALALQRETIVEHATDHYLRVLKKKSVISRHELLLTVIAPTGAIGDSSRAQHVAAIRRIDDARQRVVHNHGVLGERLDTVEDDSQRLLSYADELVFATATAFGLSKFDVAAQMRALGLDGVAAPLLPEHLESL